MKYLILICFPISVLGQKKDYEQFAFNYFMKTVFDKNYTEIKSIQFSGKTEKESSHFGFLKPCFKDSLYINLEDSFMNTEAIVKQISTSDIKQIQFKKRKTNSKLILSINSFTKAGENCYVQISIYKLHHFWDSYFFEISLDGVVKKWCKTSQII